MNIKHSIIFLGLAERAAQVRDGGTSIPKWNVLGLKNTLLVHFFPHSLGGLFAGFMLRTGGDFTQLEVFIASEMGGSIATLTFRPGPVEGSQPFMQKMSPLACSLQEGWAPVFVPLDQTVVITAQGRYLVSARFDGEQPQVIGEFTCLVVDPVPLTLERIAAIKSDPKATKAIRADFGCQACTSKLRVYAALEKSEGLHRDGYTWYQEVPDNFTCGCGKTVLELTTLKRNFFGLLGGRHSSSSDFNFQPLYEKSALEHLLAEFIVTLNSKPDEEKLQKFIENNPILLHQFPAVLLRFKPPILTKYRADFAVVTPQRELILIEIERSDTILLKRDGGQAAPLTHAIDQVRGWLHEADDHRLALLDSLNISRDLVSKVRAVVIAGRDEGNDAGHLRRLKGSLRDITLLTYDDLAGSILALIRSLEGY